MVSMTTQKYRGLHLCTSKLGLMETAVKQR